MKYGCLISLLIAVTLLISITYVQGTSQHIDYINDVSIIVDDPPYSEEIIEEENNISVRIEGTGKVRCNLVANLRNVNVRIGAQTEYDSEWSINPRTFDFRGHGNQEQDFVWSVIMKYNETNNTEIITFDGSYQQDPSRIAYGLENVIVTLEPVIDLPVDEESTSSNSTSSRNIPYTIPLLIVGGILMIVVIAIFIIFRYKKRKISA